MRYWRLYHLKKSKYGDLRNLNFTPYCKTKAVLSLQVEVSVLYRTIFLGNFVKISDHQTCMTLFALSWKTSQVCPCLSSQTTSDQPELCNVIIFQLDLYWEQFVLSKGSSLTLPPLSLLQTSRSYKGGHYRRSAYKLPENLSCRVYS